jgi:hypothetical protein
MDALGDRASALPNMSLGDADGIAAGAADPTKGFSAAVDGAAWTVKAWV